MEFVVDDFLVSFIPLLFPSVEAVFTNFALLDSFGSTRSFMYLDSLISSQYFHNLSDQFRLVFMRIQIF